MNHIISNELLQIKVQSKGAEISSILSLNSGKEYMWDANPNIWGSHAPVLFPIIGLLKNNQCTINGSSYSIPKHGFIRHNENLKVGAKTSNSISFELDSSEETLKMYPFKFKFVISFELRENELVVTHFVENKDAQDIYFSLGAHPGFKCPIQDGTTYSDYYLEFEKAENAATAILSTDGLISNQTRPVLDGNILPLHPNLFDDDALIFRNLKSHKVSLKSKQSDEVVTVKFNDFPYLGVWAKPNASFVCIEPWIGIADHEETNGDFTKKDGIITLPEGKTFKAEYSIIVDE